MKSVSDLGDLSGKRVLVRCDLNVPLDGQTITDDGRIRASLPTLNELRGPSCQDHRARPSGPSEGSGQSEVFLGTGSQAAVGVAGCRGSAGHRRGGGVGAQR